MYWGKIFLIGVGSINVGKGIIVMLIASLLRFYELPRPTG